jgi:5-aminopentanamidase
MTTSLMVTATAVRLAPVLGDRAANLELALAAIEAAARDGAQLVVLPELCTSGYSFESPTEAHRAAEPIPGPSSSAWSEAASRLGVVVVGGICELDPQGVLRNSAVVIDADGALRAVYRKVHLWGIEKNVFVEGVDPAPVVSTAAGRIGVGICYDLWFPELARSLALRGAQTIVYPSNLTYSESQPGLPHLDVVVAVATAHINRVNVVVADRCRTERGNQWLGAALIADADGRLLAAPPPGDTPATVTATFDVGAADDKQWGPFNDVLEDRRPDTY